MIGLAILVIILVMAIGFIVKIVLDWLKPVASYDNQTYSITYAELIVVSVVMMGVFVPSVLVIGNKMSIDNIVRYEQWVNGVETAANDDVTTCYAGHTGNSVAAGQSNCHWVYQSGTNNWTTQRTVEDCTTDSKGKRSCTSRTVTEYHSAPIYTPYATREHSYTLLASVGFKELSYDYDGIFLDTSPVAFSARPIRSDIPRGAPNDWLDADRRIRAGDPRPITLLDSYDNYILASGDEVLRTYSSQIEKYRAAKLLPSHTAGIMNSPARGVTGWQADKVSFAGVTVPNPGAWQAGLMRYNAALGTTLQGDMHVVLVDAKAVPSSESVDYTNALKAYWQGPEFEKRALAKNGIVVVIGVAGNGTIDWARGATGMPFGNERMLQWIQDYLPGTPLSPEALFGTPRTVMGADGKPVVTHSTPPGILERIVFQDAPFKRARMSCEDGSCVGYKDLLDRIEPTGTQKFWMAFICLFIACLWWMWAVVSHRLDRFVETYVSRPRESSGQEEDHSPRMPNPSVDRTGAAAPDPDRPKSKHPNRKRH